MTDTTFSNEHPGRGKLLSELASILKQFRPPDIDVASIMDARRKDIDALAAANEAALQGIQNLGHAQAEIFKTTLTLVETLLQRPWRSGGDTASTVTASEVLKEALYKAVAEMRELAELAYRAQVETFAVVSRRAQENIQEFTASIQPKRG